MAVHTPRERWGGGEVGGLESVNGALLLFMHAPAHINES